MLSNLKDSLRCSAKSGEALLSAAVVASVVPSLVFLKRSWTCQEQPRGGAAPLSLFTRDMVKAHIWHLVAMQILNLWAEFCECHLKPLKKYHEDFISEKGLRIESVINVNSVSYFLQSNPGIIPGFPAKMHFNNI